MLAAIDLNDDVPFEANKIKNKLAKRNLSSKLESDKPTTAQQTPHRSFSVG